MHTTVGRLGFEHVGRQVVVDCWATEGAAAAPARPAQACGGILFDAVHRTGGASWVTLQADGSLTVMIVEDPERTGATVGAPVVSRGVGAGPTGSGDRRAGLAQRGAVR